MNMEYWQAGGIPPSTISGGGDMEYWQAGSIPAMQANSSLQSILANFISSVAQVFAPVIGQGAAPSTGASGKFFPSPFAWWPRGFGE